MWQPTVDELQCAASGDVEQLERIVLAYNQPLYRFLFRLIGNASEAEDLVQETFLRMARGLGDFEGRSSFSGWLFRIARNVALDLLRRGEAGTFPLQMDPWRGPGGPGGVEGFEEAELLRWCIGRLAVDLRSALVLRDVLGFRYQEIADILDVTLSTVRWRIYRAREEVQTSYRLASGSEARPLSLGGRLVDGRLA